MPPGNKPLQTPEKGSGSHVRDEIQIHCSSNTTGEKAQPDLTSFSVAGYRTYSGPAKSTPVKVKGGRSLTRNSGRGGGGGV